MVTPQYIHLPPESSLEQMELIMPFAAVVTIDAKVTSEWRHKVSEWLVENGCLYMMAHGDECSLWDDSVDWANLEAYDFNDIPDDKLVMTTWHEDETIEGVLSFALSSVHFYPLIKHLIILDIADNSRKHEILKSLQIAMNNDEDDGKSDGDDEKFPPEPIFKNFFAWILDRLSLGL